MHTESFPCLSSSAPCLSALAVSVHLWHSFLLISTEKYTKMLDRTLRQQMSAILPKLDLHFDPTKHSLRI